MYKRNKLIGITTLCFLGISAIVACNSKSDVNVIGYSPIYMPENQVYIIDITTAKPTQNAGKIYQYGTNLTLQVDVNNGVHVINSADPSNPQKLKFISIPGVSEVAMKNNILIANNFNDLVSIDLSNLNSIALVARVKNVYEANQGIVPSEPNVYFECPDSKKGVVVGWEKKSLSNPKCKTL